MKSTQDFMKELEYKEESNSLNERYIDRESTNSGHMRKVFSGRTGDLARQLELKLDAVDNKRDCEIFLHEIEDILDDLKHHNGNRENDRVGAYANGGALGGALASSRGSEFSGALIGMGVGMLLSHLVKDDAGEQVNKAIEVVSKIRNQAKDKMLKLAK